MISRRFLRYSRDMDLYFSAYVSEVATLVLEEVVVFQAKSVYFVSGL